MSIGAVQDAMYWINGAFHFMISNWIMSIPIAMAIIIYAKRMFIHIKKVLSN